MGYTQEQIDELAKKAGEIAGENFMAGMNCCEAALSGILQTGLSDLPFETVSLASALGGGVGGFGSLCGAINGGAMGMGAFRGRKNPTAAGSPKACKDELHDKEHGLYVYAREYIEKLQEKFGSVNCRELVSGYDMSDKEQRSARVQMCKGIVAASAEQAVRSGLKNF
jgi:C_GCAxxG_C_C family probable redox protein